MENKRKKFGKKALVEWIFNWDLGGEVVKKQGDLVKIGDILFKQEKPFLSPVDGRVIKTDEEKRELVLSFKAFEFFGNSKGEDRFWGEVVIEDGRKLEIEQIEEKVIILSENCPVLIAKFFALGAKGIIVFEEVEESFLTGSFLRLSKEDREKFLSVLKLMERAVVHIDTNTGRLLLTENKKTK